MLIVGILLAFILFALWQIHNTIVSRPTQTDMSDVEDKLDAIYKLLGGDEKEKEAAAKKRKDLKPRLIGMLMVSGKSKKDAEQEATTLINDAEFEEAHQDFPSKFLSIERWVNEAEIEEHNQKKYGHLMDKAKAYIKGKEIIKPYDDDMRNYLECDSDGRSWIIAKLKDEKLLEEVTEWDNEMESSRLKHYKVT